MTKENLEQEIVEAHQRMENLLQLASLAKEQSIKQDYPIELFQQAITEISISLEELQQQNEELITTRHLLEAERQRYHDLFNFAPNSYLVTNTTEIIQEANYAAANLLNVRQSYLIGKPMSVFVHQTERQKFRQIILQLQRQGQIHREELRFFYHQGSIDFPAELTAMAVEDSQEKTGNLRWLFRDISDRYQTEQKIREQAAIRTLQIINPQVQIVAMSGLATAEALVQTTGIPIQGFLAKPFTTNQLLNFVQKIFH